MDNGWGKHPNMSEESASGAVTGLLIYSVAMLVLPLTGFFGLRQFLEEYEINEPWKDLGPAIFSFVLVNFIILAYARKAFREAVKEENEKKTS